MSDRAGRRPANVPLRTAFLLALGAMLSNAIFFLNVPGKQLVPWLSLLLAVISVACLAIGVRRAFSGLGHGRKVLSSLAGLLTLAMAAMAISAFFGARGIPAPARAPQVAAKAPDFTLTDISGQPVSLDQLFAGWPGNLPASPPKAVLLVFYRGNW